MNTVFPVCLVVLLGVLSAVVVTRWVSTVWIAILVSAIGAMVLWGAGCYALLFLTAPQEAKGPILLWPVVQTFVTAGIPASIVCVIMARRRSTAAKTLET